MAHQAKSVLWVDDEAELLEPQEWELCCGSAGIYNVTTREPARGRGIGTLLDMHEENRFRARAFYSAARAAESATWRRKHRYSVN